MEHDAGAIDAARYDVVGVDEEDKACGHDGISDEDARPLGPPAPRSEVLAYSRDLFHICFVTFGLQNVYVLANLDKKCQ